jgi:hypothetical protein
MMNLLKNIAVLLKNGRTLISLQIIAPGEIQNSLFSGEESAKSFLMLNLWKKILLLPIFYKEN